FDVVALSRSKPVETVVSVLGSYASPADLEVLDEYEIDSVVHLAVDRDSRVFEPDRFEAEDRHLRMNVLGTRTLLRFLIRRGCRRFIVASSIAVTGCVFGEAFLPRKIPIPDDHPCDAVDVYGLGKAFVEDLAFFLHRENPDVDISLFRLGAVVPKNPPPPAEPDKFIEAARGRPFAYMSLVAVSDVVEALATAVERPAGAGARRLNLVSSTASTPIPVRDALRIILGERAAELDMRHYERRGYEKAPLFSIDRLREIYDFCPSVDVLSTANPDLS
ncbi:NAD-dependent epimerase/dehydratase family protein, partial [Phytoactinopolyspora mesophila]